MVLANGADPRLANQFQSRSVSYTPVLPGELSASSLTLVLARRSWVEPPSLHTDDLMP